MGAIAGAVMQVRSLLELVSLAERVGIASTAGQTTQVISSNLNPSEKVLREACTLEPQAIDLRQS